MSKKQQVEKVQKCNAVVNAFQAGVKERPAFAKPADSEADEGEGPAKPSAKADEKNAEEAEQEETDNSAGPSTSAPARDECKANQEAWSRLRDGKGVEPEDLDKSHQLTPPAFVRPKREADDDQSLEVELEKKEQVINHALASDLNSWPGCYLNQDYKKKNSFYFDKTHTHYKSPSPGIKEMHARCQRISMATAAHYLFSSLKLGIMMKQFRRAVKRLLTLSKHPC